MKNRSKYGFVSAWLIVVQVVVAVLVFSGCNKRPYTRVKQLPLEIKLDWSAIKETNQIPARLKLLLFEENGTLRAQYDIPKEGQLLTGLLDVGTYKAICVNVTNNVEIQNSDKFETAQLVAKAVSTSTANIFGKADGSTSMVEQPGWIFSGVLPEIKVGDPLITEETSTSALSSIIMPMNRRVKVVNFNFKVTGVTNEIKTVNAALGGVASKIDLTTGEIVAGFQASSPVTLTYKPEDGTLQGTVLIFGNEAELNDDVRNNLLFSFETESGRKIPLEEDITEQLKNTGGAEGDLQIKIEGSLDVRYDAGLTTVVIEWIKDREEDLEGL